MLCCQELLSSEWLRCSGQIFRLLPTSLSLDALSEWDHVELSGSYLVRKNYNGWATIWRMWHDDRLSRLGTIHQRGRHTDSYVAIANAAPTHWRWAAKMLLPSPLTYIHPSEVKIAEPEVVGSFRYRVRYKESIARSRRERPTVRVHSWSNARLDFPTRFIAGADCCVA